VPISAVDCVQPAIQHAREQLFRPFRFGQWWRLALVGILAAQVHSGGCHFNLPVTPKHTGGKVPTIPGFPPFPHSTLPHIDASRIVQFAALIVALVLLAIILGFIFLYISSVFRFILFDSVLSRRCAIGEGWRRWHAAGRRFFLWQIVFGIAQGLFLGILIVVPLAIAAALGWFRDFEHHMARDVVAVLALVGLLLFFLLVAVVVQLLAIDFLVPIMALEGLDFADGWSRLLELIRPEPGSYAVYLLLKIVLAIAAAILFGIIALIPSVVIIAPAVGAVIAGHAAGLGWTVATVSIAIIGGTVLLAVLIAVIAFVNVPVTVFFPAFAIYFFAGRYARLDAILHPAPPVGAATASELPPSPESPPPMQPPPLPPTPEPIG
jgi:hypothetical protein